MRNFILFIVFICWAFSSYIYGQNYDVDTIKGYYVVKYDKSEIEVSYNQPNQIPIDYTTSKYFFPTQLAGKEIMQFDAISNYSVKDSIYIFPDVSDYILRKVPGLDDSEIPDMRTQMRNALKSAPLYAVKNDSIHLYKCIYLEGVTQKKNIHEFSEDWQYQLLWDFSGKTMEVRNQDLFFITSISELTPYVDNPFLIRWN